MATRPDARRFVTHGVKHIKMWEYTGRAGQLYRPQSCAWAGAEAQDVLCAAFLPPGVDRSVDELTQPVEVRCAAPAGAVDSAGVRRGHAR